MLGESVLVGKENSRKSLSPAIRMSVVTANHSSIFVVREDLLPGGTKQRAVLPFLRELIEEGYDQFTYASPFAGYAQVALAYVCRALNVKCTLFVERDPATNALHEFSALAESYGAKLSTAESLVAAEALAEKWSQSQSGVHKIPLGFNSSAYKTHMFLELKSCWSQVQKIIGRTPETLWLPVGSGVLTQIFSRVVSPSVQLKCVNVHVLDQTDQRIQALQSLPKIQLMSCPLRFAEKAQVLPALPSNIHYDAKLWDFISRYGSDGDIWWNVAR